MPVVDASRGRGRLRREPVRGRVALAGWTQAAGGLGRAGRAGPIARWLERELDPDGVPAAAPGGGLGRGACVCWPRRSRRGRRAGRTGSTRGPRGGSGRSCGSPGPTGRRSSAPRGPPEGCRGALPGLGRAAQRPGALDGPGLVVPPAVARPARPAPLAGRRPARPAAGGPPGELVARRRPRGGRPPGAGDVDPVRAVRAGPDLARAVVDVGRAGRRRATAGAADALGQPQLGRRRRVVVPGRPGAGGPDGGPAPRAAGSPCWASSGTGRATPARLRLGLPDGVEAGPIPESRGLALATPPGPAGVGPGLPDRAPQARLPDRPRAASATRRGDSSSARGRRPGRGGSGGRCSSRGTRSGTGSRSTGGP